MKVFSSYNLEKGAGGDIPVTLVKDISDETGEKILIDDLDNNRKYGLRIRRDKGVIDYFFLSFLKESLKLEIQRLNLEGFFGEYFVVPKGGRR